MLIYTSPLILRVPPDHCWKAHGLLLAMCWHEYPWVPDSAVLHRVCKLRNNQSIYSSAESGEIPTYTSLCYWSCHAAKQTWNDSCAIRTRKQELLHQTFLPEAYLEKGKHKIAAAGRLPSTLSNLLSLVCTSRGHMLCNNRHISMANMVIPKPLTCWV